jgi:hypothetical protein
MPIGRCRVPSPALVWRIVLRDALNAVPTAWLLFAAVGASLIAVLVSVVLVRRIVPSTREGYHAEISAPMLGVVAALFGLLLAFVIIIAYQNFLAAQANLSREADSLSSIVRDSAAFPEPARSNVVGAVGTYVHAVVDDEWPSMKKGNDNVLAWNGLDSIFTAFLTVKPKSPAATSFYDDAVTQLNATLAARRDRLQSVSGGIPGPIFFLILFGAFVIIGYAVLVGSPSFWFHALGAAAIAMVVAVSLVVLIDLSYPFSGNVAISPAVFKTGSLGQFFYRP